MAKKYVADLTVFRAQDARKTGAFLETGSLHPPLAALRLFPCTIEILSFQNFYKVLKACSACRKNFFDTLSGPETPGRLRMGWPPAYLRSFFWFFCSLGSF